MNDAFPTEGGGMGRAGSKIADSCVEVFRIWRLPDLACRDIKRGVHPAFRLMTLKSEPRLPPSPCTEIPDVAPTVLCASAAGLRHDDGSDERFRRPAEADATGTGAGRAL